MNITDVVEVKANPNIPKLAPGDTVKVRQKVTEGEKTRIQVFQGVVIRIRNAGAGTNFTVRRVSYGIGVERTFPIYSPMIDGVEIVRHGKVRRAKLYYLRGLSARASRIKERRVEPTGEALHQPEQTEEGMNDADSKAGGATEEAVAESAPGQVDTAATEETSVEADTENPPTEQ